MKLKMAMIGGGQGSFIGPVHRMAAALDGECELVAAALSSDPDNALKSGREIGLPDDRIYTNWERMIEAERILPSEQRPDFISIVTPNHLHFIQALKSLEAGFNVVCDKPLCISVSEAEKLASLVNSSRLHFCLTHNYTGYPMVKLARDLVRRGELGTIRKVATEYLQGWLSADALAAGNKQAGWRSDPSKAGIGGTMADIGTHAFNLAEYISGIRVKSVCADITPSLFNRKLDDDANVLLRFETGIKGTLIASQIALGEENNLKVKVYGDKGSIIWEQMNPNNLIHYRSDKPYQVYRTATGFGDAGQANLVYSRLPSGHPEGFIEAFANIYRSFAVSLKAAKENLEYKTDYPGIEEGVRGMRFLEAAIRSSAENSIWQDL
jgi:predicted dehydrogenase